MHEPREDDEIWSSLEHQLTQISIVFQSRLVGLAVGGQGVDFGGDAGMTGSVQSRGLGAVGDDEDEIGGQEARGGGGVDQCLQVETSSTDEHHDS